MRAIRMRYPLLIGSLVFAVQCDDQLETDHFFEEMKSELASRGRCWVKAVENSDSDDRSKEQLAFNFMNCFFEGANFPTYSCPERERLPMCDDFRKLMLGVHRNVYLVFHHQAVMLIEYLKGRARHKNIGQQIALRGVAPVELRENLSKASDFLLQSLNSGEGIFDLKQIVAKSHQEYKKSLQTVQRILYEITMAVQQYEFLGLLIAGLALFAVKRALSGVI